MHQVKELLEMNYSNSAVVFLGRITSNTNKMSDSRDETQCHQSIALVKIISKAEMCWFVMYSYYAENDMLTKTRIKYTLQKHWEKMFFKTLQRFICIVYTTVCFQTETLTRNISKRKQDNHIFP